MGSNAAITPISQTTPQGIYATGRVDLIKDEFTKLLDQKGYDVLLDKALSCPCRNVSEGQPLTNCRNCGGCGWIFINRTQTKVVLQGMSKDLKFQEWSAENVGMIRLTAHHTTNISYMDRITLTNALVIHNQCVFCNTYEIDGESAIRVKLDYVIKEIHEIFLFVASDQPLKFLQHEEDYTIQGNVITLNQSYTDAFDSEKPYTLTVRYKHNPEFHVIDFSREAMSTYTTKTGPQVNQEMPISALARKSHYVLDEQSYSNDFLLNNSYVKGCSLPYEAINNIVDIINKRFNALNEYETILDTLSSDSYSKTIDVSVSAVNIVDIDTSTSNLSVYVRRESSQGWMIERIQKSKEKATEVVVSQTYTSDDPNVSIEDSWQQRTQLLYD